MQAMLQGIDYFHGGGCLEAYRPPWQGALEAALAMTVVAGFGGIAVREALN